MLVDSQETESGIIFETRFRNSSMVFHPTALLNVEVGRGKLSVIYLWLYFRNKFSIVNISSSLSLNKHSDAARKYIHHLLIYPGAFSEGY